MVNIETHDVPFSFEQPGNTLSPLTAILQKALNEPRTRGARGKAYLASYQVLIIDANDKRAHFLAQALASMGYHPQTVTTSLEAFTLFLRGTVIPFAIILGQEDASNRLFLQRLVQQIAQKYGWETPLIRLLSQTTGKLLGPAASPPGERAPAPRMSVPPRTSPLLPSEQAMGEKLSGPLTPTPQPYPSQGPNTMPRVPQTSPLTFPQQTPQTPPAIHLPPMSRVNTGPMGQEVARRTERPNVEKVNLEGHDMGRYHISTLLGSGPYGSVYLAYDRLREQDQALKAIQTNAVPFYLMEGAMEEEHLFQQEETLLGKIAHPHILPLMHSGKSYISGAPFVYKTMPLYKEGSLAQWLKRQQQNGVAKMFAPQEVVQILLQIGETLQHAHNHNVIYQNLKLPNLILREDAKDIRQLYILLADFAVPQDGSFFSDAQESFAYMAPERWVGQISPASDQYALAVLAYELLTGRTPFQGTSEATWRHLHGNMQPQPPTIYNPTLPAFVNKVLLRALAKRPEDRFSSISIFARTFQRYCP